MLNVKELNKVTIGLCVKNSEKTVRETIESILSQNYPLELLQIIIVDGCSKDKTLEIIDCEFSKAYRAVETYSDKGEGLGTARQIVVDKAEGKYVIFVDADIMLFNDFIRNHVEYMDKNPNFSIAFGKPMPQERTLVANVWDLTNYAAGAIGIGASICRLEALRQVNGFDTEIKGASEDRDLIVRFQLCGLQSSVNEKAKFFHRHRENLGSLWVEQSWFGYGDHYFAHKHGSTIGAAWRRFPFVEFILSLRLASNTYQLTCRKLSFLILPLMLFGDIGWWTGFAKAHMAEYGHIKNA